MENIKSNLFSPINSAKYCDYFYVLSVLSFITFIYALFSKTIEAYKTKQTGWDHFLSFMVILTKFFMYAQCRLLYSMCVH